MTLSVAPDAAAGQEAVSGGPLPVVVTARTLTADNKKKTVTYRTGVVVKRGGMTLTADEVVIHIASGKGAGSEGSDPLFAGSGGIETIEARGDVKIVVEDKTATSDKATYYTAGDKVVMSGSPRVWQGANVLSGKSITMNITDDTISVEDARTVLYPKDEKGTAAKP